MKRFCSMLFVLVIGVAGIGFYRGWFTVSESREAVSHKVDVHVTVDPDKVKADAQTVKDKASELTGEVKEGVSR